MAATANAKEAERRLFMLFSSSSATRDAPRELMVLRNGRYCNVARF